MEKTRNCGNSEYTDLAKIVETDEISSGELYLTLHHVRQLQQQAQKGRDKLNYNLGLFMFLVAVGLSRNVAFLLYVFRKAGARKQLFLNNLFFDTI
jgi:hypothetical protein